MATSRPVVTIYNEKDGTAVGSAVMPSVFTSPLRPDIVRFVWTNMAKNHRQAYGVAPNAGYQTSAESWGTGRAVARIPRVSGGGTHHAGQAAFGNQCRGGGMFAPNKTWRRWHRKINKTQKRHAVATAIAATGIPALAMARGHRIDNVPEMPLVVSDNAQAISKTKEAAAILEKMGCKADLDKCIASKKLHCGKGKMRGRRYTLRRGPLVIYSQDNGITRAFRNLPGVELCHVERLNLLLLAPGGTLGRMCLWTASAFKRLQEIYGRSTSVATAPLKKGYHLQRPLMSNPDLARIINSEEIQSVVRPALKQLCPNRKQHKNLLTNRRALCRINPAAKTLKRAAKRTMKLNLAAKAAGKSKRRASVPERRLHRKAGTKFIQSIRQAFTDKGNEVMKLAVAEK